MIISRVAPQVVAAITHAAAGNPLALVELPATLTAGQRAGTAALELPLAPGGRLQRAFAGRVEALDDKARQAVLIAAAHAGTELPVIAAACLHAGTDAGHLADAEASGLVQLGAGQLRFTHPLIRGRYTPRHRPPAVAPLTPPSPRYCTTTMTAARGIWPRPRSSPTRRWRSLWSGSAARR